MRLSRPNSAYRIISFSLLAALLSACSAVQRECPTNPNAKYEYELINNHVSEMMFGESKKFKRWENPIRYLLVGFSDEKSMDNIYMHSRKISDHIGIDVVPRTLQEKTNAYLIFPGDMEEAYDADLVQSIYLKTMGYTDGEFLIARDNHIKSQGDAVYEVLSKASGEYVFSFFMMQYKDYSYEEMNGVFLKALYSMVTSFKPSDVVTPSVTNTLGVGGQPNELNDFDLALLEGFYQKSIFSGDDLVSVIPKISCYVYQELDK